MGHCKHPRRQGKSGGRLPFTWAKRLEDYAATDPAYPERSSKGVDGKTTFSEGVYVGYRWFDKQKIDPLFPFGFGLTYTELEYSKLKVVPASDGGLDVRFELKNIGRTASDEVPQVYLGAPGECTSGCSVCSACPCRIRSNFSEPRRVEEYYDLSSFAQTGILVYRARHVDEGNWDTRVVNR